ncbi:MAG: hypothetical protein ABFD58_05530 [Anaerolineaceae bacterium]
MDTWTILWIILVILVIGSFAILIIFNNRQSALEREIKEAIGQVGWKIHDDLITGSDSTGISWQMGFSGEGINRSLHWTTTSVHLRKGALVIMPATTADIFSSANRRLAYRLIRSGKNWLEDGIMTLQQATSRGKELALGTEEFRKHFSIYAIDEEEAQTLIVPEIEAMLSHFPNKPGQPSTPVYVFLNHSVLQVYAETAEHSMDQFTHIVMLGIALAHKVAEIQKEEANT